MNEITIGDKVYISSKRAAEITGYAKDYVGQLCREGHIEAKMVGRSWYVYEPSIRAHRFGEAESHQPEKADEPAESAKDEDISVPEPSIESEDTPTWAQPSYTAEEPELIPELVAPVTPVNQIPEVKKSEETLTDMQQAWKEWFSRKQEVHEVPLDEDEESVEEVMDEVESTPSLVQSVEEEEATETEDIEDDEVVEVPLHRVREEQNYAVTQEHRSLDIAPVRAASPVPTVEARIIQERVISSGKRRKKRVSNAPAIAALIGLSLISIATAIVGSGMADSYLHTVVGNNPVVNYLVGNNTYSRQ